MTLADNVKGHQSSAEVGPADLQSASSAGDGTSTSTDMKNPHPHTPILPHKHACRHVRTCIFHLTKNNSTYYVPNII